MPETQNEDPGNEAAAQLLYERFGNWRKTWRETSEDQRERFRQTARQVRAL